MAEFKDQISKDIIAAMKAKDKIRLNVLRYLKKLFIENDTSGDPKPELDIAIAHAKKTKDSISMFPVGSPQIEAIHAELAVLAEYLPKPMEEAEVIKIIQEIISNLENANMGAVMKELSPKIKGQFDGKKASQLVVGALKS